MTPLPFLFKKKFEKKNLQKQKKKKNSSCVKPDLVAKKNPYLSCFFKTQKDY